MRIDRKYKLRITGVTTFIMLLFICETMEAQYGHMHRATRRRTAIVVSSATHAHDQQQAEAATAAAAEQTPPPAETAPTPAVTTPPPASTQAKLAIGSVVTKLPTGCVSLAISGQQYYQCGANYYVAAYQEGTLIYMTVAPPK